MGIRESLMKKRDAIIRIAGQFGASNVRLFGSVARGDSDEGSDIDMLVDFAPGRTLLDHTGLMLKLEELLGRRVDVASSRGLRDRVRDRVIGEAVPL